MEFPKIKAREYRSHIISKAPIAGLNGSNTRNVEHGRLFDKFSERLVLVHGKVGW